MRIEIEIGEEYNDILEDMHKSPRFSLEEIISGIVDRKMYEIRTTQNDMEKFRKYQKQHPFTGKFFALYRLRLRRALGWSNGHLMDIEDEILASGL